MVERLRAATHSTAVNHFAAFYSSELGGIITDPSMMFIHADDHMVHRGHGVFDTALITDGHLYQLDAHLDRFKASAAAAGLTFPKTDVEIKRIILDTAAASRRLNGAHARGIPGWHPWVDQWFIVLFRRCVPL